jgi:hypothetical protein
VKSSYCIFAVRPKNFHFSSLKEIENQLKSFKKVLAENNMARTFALPKNGRRKSFEPRWIINRSGARERQKIFESWEATARWLSLVSN